MRAEPLTLRVFVAATKDGYRVMPGGIALSARGDDDRLRAPASDYSKDVWVLSDESVDTFSMLGRSLQATALRRSDRDLPSRTADNLYWLGRYLERAEGAVRLYRSLFSYLSGEKCRQRSRNTRYARGDAGVAGTAERAAGAAGNR